MSKRLLGSAAAVALLASGLLSGCGGSGDYCDKVSSANDEQFDDFSTDEAQDALQEMADAAPGEIKDDWEVFMDGIRAVSGDDLGDFDAEDLDKFTAAGEKITTYTAEECDIDLDAV